MNHCKPAYDCQARPFRSTFRYFFSMIGARTPIYAICTLHNTGQTECLRSGLFSFCVFMFLVSLFFISNALYLTPFTFCYNMIMMHMNFYFDINRRSFPR